MKRIVNLLFTVVAVMVLVNAVSVGYRTVKHIIYPVRYFEHIHKFSSENRLDEYLVMAVIKAESNYIYDASSGVARGLMQLTDETADWIAKRIDLDFELDDVEDPKTNIQMGCYYLRYLIDYYNGQVDVALAAYNAGPGNVSAWLKDEQYSSDGKTLHHIPFKETRNYVKKVNEYHDEYRKLYRLDANLAARIS